MVIFDYDKFIEFRNSNAVDVFRAIASVKMHLSSMNTATNKDDYYSDKTKFVEIEFRTEADETHFRLKYL